MSWIFALPENYFNETQIHIKINFHIDELNNNLEVARQERRFVNPILSLSIPKDENISSTILIKLDKDYILNEKNLKSNSYLYDLLNSILLKILFPTPYFALAERSAFNLFHEQFSSLISGEHQNRNNKINGDDIWGDMAYPFINYLTGIRRKRKTGTGIKIASDYLESQILKGVVEQDDRGALNFISEFRNGEKLNIPMQASASAIKSLAYFDVLIREQLRSGNIVFIDEVMLQRTRNMQHQ